MTKKATKIENGQISHFRGKFYTIFAHFLVGKMQQIERGTKQLPSTLSEEKVDAIFVKDLKNPQKSTFLQFQPC